MYCGPLFKSPRGSSFSWLLLNCIYHPQTSKTDLLDYSTSYNFAVPAPSSFIPANFVIMILLHDVLMVFCNVISYYCRSNRSRGNESVGRNYKISPASFLQKIQRFFPFCCMAVQYYLVHLDKISKPL